ncbi:hypothetical protein GGR57DRAFT_506047 [Xylariaceae sp. FL1272]|nr:hypothetical protein GGR57DRAFT_506047 [Xylariaceae sp. FL1272]
MKFSGIVATLSMAAASVYGHPSHPSYPQGVDKFPTTYIGGVKVIDTKLVRDARKVIENFDGFLYKHSMRTWLFGAAAINANETLSRTIDIEMHAVATVLHDLGWDMTPGSPHISPDNRFEVDGALGAVKFIKEYKGKLGSKWDELRLTSLHDSIALHGSPGLIVGKNINVQHALRSIAFDNPGARDPAIPEKDYNSILAEFPGDDIGYGTNLTWTWLATTKPIATYNTIVEPFGVAFVPGYNASQYRIFNLLNPQYVGGCDVATA